MNPVFTLQNAILYLEDSAPEDRDISRSEAMHILSEAYKILFAAHRKERPDCTPEWMKQYNRNVAKGNPNN